MLLLLCDLWMWMSSRNSLSDGQRWPSRRGNETADRQPTDRRCDALTFWLEYHFVDQQLASSSSSSSRKTIFLVVVSFAGWGRWQLRVIGADSSDCSTDMLDWHIFWLPLFKFHIEKLSKMKGNWISVIVYFAPIAMSIDVSISGRINHVIIGHPKVNNPN